jgi:hypothetical protein
MATSTSATPATPDYVASLTKQLQPSKPLPVNKGPYLDQTGQMPVQSVMSNADFAGALGPAWDEFSKPGGYLDKAYQGQTQILDPSGNPMSIQQITDAVRGAGKTFTPNPFLAIPTLEGQLYNNESKNVGSVYQQLTDALNAGRQDYEQRTAKYGSDIAGYFDQAGNDIAKFGGDRMAANQAFANSIGLGGTTGAGSQTSVLADQLARLGAINATNRANAQSTFAQRQGIINDLLQQRALTAATSGADAQSAIAQMAAQHWGLADPNKLYQAYLANQGELGLAKSQLDLQLAKLQAGAAGASGKGGKGGKGRKGGSGGAGATAAAQGANAYDEMRQLFADPASLGATGVDPMSSDAYLLASAFANKYGLGDNAVGNTLGGVGRMGVR